MSWVFEVESIVVLAKLGRLAGMNMFLAHVLLGAGLCTELVTLIPGQGKTRPGWTLSELWLLGLMKYQRAVKAK